MDGMGVDVEMRQEDTGTTRERPCPRLIPIPPLGKDEMGHANETMRGNRSKTREANSRLTPVPSPREGRNDGDGENEVKEGDKKETTSTTKMKVQTTKRRRQLNNPGQY